MKVLITGASGFIGIHTVRHFAAQGHEVTAVYRRATPPRLLAETQEWGVRLAQADLSEPFDTARLLRGQQAVMHIAGIAGDWGRPHKYFAVNYGATQRLYLGALNQGVESFVYCSSVAVHGFGGLRQATEEGPYHRLMTPYQRSKKAAEDWLLSRAAGPVRIVIVRPGNVYGPGDNTTMFPYLDALRSGTLGYVDRGERLTCPLFVGDLVEALHLAALSERSDGHVFNVTGGEDVTWRDLSETAARFLGCRPPQFSLPYPLALAAAHALNALFVLAGSRHPPAITPYRITQVGHDYHFSVQKAREVLGFVPKIGLREGMRLTVDDYVLSRSTRTKLQESKGRAGLGPLRAAPSR